MGDKNRQMVVVEPLFILIQTFLPSASISVFLVVCGLVCVCGGGALLYLVACFSWQSARGNMAKQHGVEKKENVAVLPLLPLTFPPLPRQWTRQGH